MSWKSSGSLGFRGSRKGTPFAAQQAAQNAARHGARSRPSRRGCAGARSGIGPRVGHPRAGRRGHRGEVDPRRHPGSAQRLPAAETAQSVSLLSALVAVSCELTRAGTEARSGDVNRPSSEVRRRNGTLYRSSLPPLPSRRHEAFSEGHQVHLEIVAPSRSATSLPDSMARTARPRSSATACSCTRSRRPSACTSRSRASSATYYEKANRAQGVTGELLIQQLERRLDNVAYRLGFAISRRQARQVVRHGHVSVNGKKVNIPSYQVSAGDEISIRENSQEAGHRGAGRAVRAARTRFQRGWK